MVYYDQGANDKDWSLKLTAEKFVGYNRNIGFLQESKFDGNKLMMLKEDESDIAFAAAFFAVSNSTFASSRITF